MKYDGFSIVSVPRKGDIGVVLPYELCIQTYRSPKPSISPQSEKIAILDTSQVHGG